MHSPSVVHGSVPVPAGLDRVLAWTGQKLYGLSTVRGCTAARVSAGRVQQVYGGCSGRCTAGLSLVIVDPWVVRRSVSGWRFLATCGSPCLNRQGITACFAKKQPSATASDGGMSPWTSHLRANACGSLALVSGPRPPASGLRPIVQ